MATNEELDELQRSALVDEARRVEEASQYSSQGQFEASKIWKPWSWILGGTTGVASGLGGVLTFADGPWQYVAAALAMVAVASAAIHTTLKPDRKVAQCRANGNAYLAVQTAARRLHSIDLITGADLRAARDRLDALASEKERIDESSDVISRRAYKRARANIAKGGQRYEVDP